ncbi:MAG: hypothetical protein HKN03_13160 [Acidimicrobiales bacterium]|nr:hypothetical protein [Acidimicrobiales bacterium]
MISDNSTIVPPDGQRNATRAAALRRLATLILVAALISPALRNEDGIPLSTYPMYAATRGNVSSYVTALGVTDTGANRTLSTSTIAETMDWLIAQSFLNDAVARGEGAQVCRQIAGRAPEGLTAIEIATERHDTVARLRGEESLLHRNVHARCEIRS